MVHANKVFHVIILFFTVPESVASISREILSQFTASVFWSDPPSNVDRILFYHIVLYRNGRRNVTIVINGSTNTLNLTDLCE